MVFLTIHAGSGCNDNSQFKQEDLSSCDTKGEIFKILDKAPKGLINAVVSGHTHQGVAKIYNGTAVLQSYSHGQSVLYADISLQGLKPVISPISNVCGAWVQTGYFESCARESVVKYDGKLLEAEFLGKVMKPDAHIAALLEADFARVSEIKKAPLGIHALNYFARDYYEESSLGNLVVDLMRSYVATHGLGDGEEEPKAILGMTNNGGLRANIEKGPLTYGQVFDVLPFDNALALLKVSGSIVLKLMEFGVDRKHGGLSWSGATIEAESCKVTLAKAGDLDIDPTAHYWVVTNDYLATGGSGVDELKLTDEQVVILDGAPFLRDAVVDVLKADKKDLDATQYFTKDKPRVRVKKVCETQ